MSYLKIKLIYTAVVYFIFLQLALRYGICGPSLSDLRDKLRVTTEDVSNSVSVMSVGICIGAISSGFICKIISRELGTSFLVTATAGFVASITFFKQFGLFLTWNLLVGITSGASVSLCESWILEIWPGAQSGPFMQALQFFRGIGYIIAPVLANPFLSKREVVFLEENSLFAKNGTNESNEKLFHERVYPSHIQTPYILNAAMLLFGGICCLGLYITKRHSSLLQKGISREEILTNSTNSINSSSKEVVIENKLTPFPPKTKINNREKYFNYSIVALSSVFYLFFYEEVIVIFLPTFSTKLAINLSTSQASLLTTAFSLSNIFGKAIGVLLALKISHFVILYLNLFIMISSLILIILFGNSSVIMLWVGVCLHGFGLSSSIASLYTLMESSITMSPSICGLLNMMGTLGSVFLSPYVGKYLDHFPMILMYACLTCAFICSILFIAMHALLLCKHKIIPKLESGKIECTNSKINTN